MNRFNKYRFEMSLTKLADTHTHTHIWIYNKHNFQWNGSKSINHTFESSESDM